MNLDLSETQSLLQETVRGYLEKELPFERVRALEREQRHDATRWKSLCQQGWIGVPIDESLGGGGGSRVEAGLLLLEFARRAAIVPVAEVLACARVIQDHAPAARSRELLPEVIAGGLIPVPALAEDEGRLTEVSASVAGGVCLYEAARQRADAARH